MKKPSKPLEFATDLKLYRDFIVHLKKATLIKAWRSQFYPTKITDLKDQWVFPKKNIIFSQKKKKHQSKFSDRIKSSAPPFSIHHKNPRLIDATMVWDLELKRGGRRKMRSQLGEVKLTKLGKDVFKKKNSDINFRMLSESRRKELWTCCQLS